MLARVSSLQRYTILSNSDAHSAQNLGREANEFDCPLTYDGIARAIRDNEIVRTIEFFPEEGKYHHDGHRHCGVSLPPAADPEIGRHLPGLRQAADPGGAVPRRGTRRSGSGKPAFPSATRSR